MAITLRRNINNTPNAKPKKTASAAFSVPRTTGIALLVVLLLTALSAYWSHQIYIVQAEHDQLKLLVDEQAEARVQSLSQFIGRYRQKLAPLANDPALLAAIAQSEMSPAALQQVKTLFPEAIALRLLNLERQDLFPMPEGTPLSFTELDMIYRTERGDEVAPEAKKVDKSWTILFAVGIRDKNVETPVGTLLVTIPGKLLIRTLSALSPELGGTQLARVQNGGAVALFAVGSGDTGPTKTLPIPHSHWQIQFQGSYVLDAQTLRNPVFLHGAHAVGGLLLLILVYWLGGWFDPVRRQKKAIEDADSGRDAHFDEDEEEALRNLLLAAEDQDVLGLQEAGEPEAETASEPPRKKLVSLPAEIFRAYDIRGTVPQQITPALSKQVGKAMGTLALMSGQTSLFVARDGRLHSEELAAELIQGILSTGCHVRDLGLQPTPLLYFATCESGKDRSGIMVTASHNPATYNGFKMVIDGKTLFDDAIVQVRERIEQQDFYRGEGRLQSIAMTDRYIDRIVGDIALSGRIKIVIDAGNGATGELAPRLFEQMGCDVVPLFCDIDGNFPNHAPDPTIPAHLEALIDKVQKSGADLGIALDGDGDRVVVVTPSGNIIWPDRMLMLFAKEILTRNPDATVIFDVKSTRVLKDLVSAYGGHPVMWKSGHSHMKNKMLETGALVGGELSGHIFIKDRWYGFDDGMYATARLLEIMTQREQSIDDLFEGFKTMPSTPEILIPVDEQKKFKIVKRLIAQGNFEDGKLITLDGLRVDFAKGWGLVRASNTSAALTARFEAETPQLITQLQQLFRRELLKVDSSINIPF